MPALDVFTKGVVHMVTYSNLFAFVIMLCAVVTLAIAISERSDRGSFLPLPDHRDVSLISRHCHSMTVARRMPARASTAAALRAYRAKNSAPALVK